MRLACDRFVAGMRADYIQENLLQTPPDSLEDARRVAKRLEAMVTHADHALLEAVQQNTIAVQRLVEQMATIQSRNSVTAGRRPSGGRSRNRCWKCGEPGHLRSNCPLGNEGRSPAASSLKTHNFSNVINGLIFGICFHRFTSSGWFPIYFRIPITAVYRLIV